MRIFNNDWDDILEDEMEKDYYKKIRNFLINEYKTKTVYPKADDVMAALKITSYADTKLVILGQDPYHGPNQANGLAFSVNRGERLPPSLRNMYKELESDLGIEMTSIGDLTSWAQQGVLLLNTSLTVIQGQANSHSKIGWSIFTDRIISELSRREEPVIFVLWGNNAKSKEALIDTSRHYVIKSVHPSPLSASRGFFGSRPYSKVNNILKSIGSDEIDFTVK